MPAYIYIRVHSYHWILLIIKIEEGIVLVLDSLRKDPNDYRSLRQMLDR